MVAQLCRYRTIVDSNSSAGPAFNNDYHKLWLIYALATSLYRFSTEKFNVIHCVAQDMHFEKLQPPQLF